MNCFLRQVLAFCLFSFEIDSLYTQDEYLARNPQEQPGGDPWLNAWRMIKDPDYNLDNDPLPAWMRAKRAIVENWDAIEELNGNRQQTIDRIGAFTELVSLSSSRLSY